MFYGALLLLVMAITAALIGYGAAGGTLTTVASVSFFLFLAASLALLVAGLRSRRYA